MQSSLHTLEAHVRAVNTNRLQQVLQAEQIRLANQDHPGSVGRTIMTIRLSIGNALITLGEKLHNQPATNQSAVNAPRTKAA